MNDFRVISCRFISFQTTLNVIAMHLKKAYNYKVLVNCVRKEILLKKKNIKLCPNVCFCVVQNPKHSMIGTELAINKYE